MAGSLGSYTIDNLLSMSWDSISVIGVGGFVATKETLKSIRTSVAGLEEIIVKKRLEELEKLNWVEESLSGGVIFDPSREDHVEEVKNTLQKYKTENKKVVIKLDDEFQDELPALENLKLKKIELREWTRRTYEQRTLKTKSREIIGIQMLLITE